MAVLTDSFKTALLEVLNGRRYIINEEEETYGKYPLTLHSIHKFNSKLTKNYGDDDGVDIDHDDPVSDHHREHFENSEKELKKNNVTKEKISSHWRNHEHEHKTDTMSSQISSLKHLNKLAPAHAKLMDKLYN